MGYCPRRYCIQTFLHPIETTLIYSTNNAMADNPKLNSLLKWAVNNSEEAEQNGGSQEKSDPRRGLDAEALAQLMGGPSDADLMKSSMTAIQSPEVDLKNKLIAFDNFEQLIENIDNANNMENLALWMPLVEQLQNTESEMRRMAAWCIGTAVQNNPRAQERCLALDTIPQLVKLARVDPVQATRKKACFALSSEVRNYKPALDVLLQELPAGFAPSNSVDAGDMDAIDVLMGKMREEAQSGAAVPAAS